MADLVTKRKQRKPPNRPVMFRADAELLERLDKHIARMRQKAPGARWTRASAALNLVLCALDDIESSP